MTRSTWLVVTAAVALNTTPAPAYSQETSSSLAELQLRARADSNDPVAHYNVAVLLFAKKKLEDAERSLRQAVAIDPHFPPALMLLSRVLAARADTGPLAAFVSGRRIMFVRIGANNSEAPQLRRRAFLLDPLLELGPPDRGWLPMKWKETLSTALRHYERGEWMSAAGGFQSVIDRTARTDDSTRVPPVALWYRARCAMNMNDYDSAIRHLRWLSALRESDSSSRALTWNPFLGEELRYVLAYVHQQAGRLDEAVALYQDLVANNLSLEIAHSHLADIYEAQERWPDAIVERRRAIDANPDDMALLFELGSTLAYGGQYAEAEDALIRFSESHPRESRTYYLLGFARMRLQKPQAAREALTRYLALAPSRYAEQIEDARRRLEALGPEERR
jgi:tetratricopeptide (TPR) repeat protein